MDGKEGTLYRALKQEEDSKDYPCVWYVKIQCPIRTKWKLKPENLTSWCGVCKQIGYLDEQKALIKSQVTTKTVTSEEARKEITDQQ